MNLNFRNSVKYFFVFPCLFSSTTTTVRIAFGRLLSHKRSEFHLSAVHNCCEDEQIQWPSRAKHCKNSCRCGNANSQTRSLNKVKIMMQTKKLCDTKQMQTLEVKHRIIPRAVIHHSTLIPANHECCPLTSILSVSGRRPICTHTRSHTRMPGTCATTMHTHRHRLTLCYLMHYAVF